MFCRKCGYQMPDDAAFCEKCGTPVAAPAPEADPVSESEPVVEVVPCITSDAPHTSYDIPVTPKKKSRKELIVGIIVFLVLLCVSCFSMGGSCNHDWLDATCTEPKTCSKCGETEGEALGHDWQEATYTEPMTCSRCDETLGKPLSEKKSSAYINQIDEMLKESLGNVVLATKYDEEQDIYMVLTTCDGAEAGYGSQEFEELCDAMDDFSTTLYREFDTNNAILIVSDKDHDKCLYASVNGSDGTDIFRD